MSTSVPTPLNNNWLYEGPIPSHDYNCLPHIDDMRDAAASHANAHAVLLGIISTHGMSDKFSLHLVHKHFNIPEGRVMVYESVKGKSHEDFVLCSPRIPDRCANLRGLYFKANAEGRMVAYEFTTDARDDMADAEDFVNDFSRAVVRLGVQDIFALTASSICPPDAILTEFEMSHVLSTVLVSNSSWLPTEDVVDSTSTDWVATSDYAQYANHTDGSVPGIIQLKCTKTRTGRHFNVTCSKTRNGSHLGHAPLPIGSGPPTEILTMNGEVLEEGSKAHGVVSNALQMIATF